MSEPYGQHLDTVDAQLQKHLDNFEMRVKANQDHWLSEKADLIMENKRLEQCMNRLEKSLETRLRDAIQKKELELRQQKWD